MWQGHPLASVDGTPLELLGHVKKYMNPFGCWISCKQSMVNHPKIFPMYTVDRHLFAWVHVACRFGSCSQTKTSWSGLFMFLKQPFRQGSPNPSILLAIAPLWVQFMLRIFGEVHALNVKNNFGIEQTLGRSHPEAFSRLVWQFRWLWYLSFTLAFRLCSA